VGVVLGPLVGGRVGLLVGTFVGIPVGASGVVVGPLVGGRLGTFDNAAGAFDGAETTGDVVGKIKL
jgi:hypothetical protein